jgi:hypothetical protein
MIPKYQKHITTLFAINWDFQQVTSPGGQSIGYIEILISKTKSKLKKKSIYICHSYDTFNNLKKSQYWNLDNEK